MKQLFKVKASLVAFMLLSVGFFTSCKSNYLEATGVAYQSVCSPQAVASKADIPSDAKIVLHSVINADGDIDVIVENCTEEVMVIDRTKTFFRGTSGTSVPYYDPTVRTSTQSTTNAGTKGATVNLGAIAGAAGMGGAVGRALSGVNVGGSTTQVTTNVNTTYYIDQPQMSIAPHGLSSLGRLFNVEGLGTNFLKSAIASSLQDVSRQYSEKQSYATCTISIAYSFDEGKNYERMEAEYYANTLLINRVKATGKVNDALRSLYMNKADCLREPWYLLYFHSKNPGSWTKGVEILNYK